MNRGEKILAVCWEILQKKMFLEGCLLKESLKEYKPSEIHCIQFVEENPNSNVTKLSNAFNMTTGGVTKLTKKLVAKKLLKTYKSPGNKKEIYFCLTDKGREVYDIHKKLHKKFQKRDEQILSGITEEEYKSISEFFKTYGNHLDKEIEKIGIDLKSGCLDKL